MFDIIAVNIANIPVCVCDTLEEYSYTGQVHNFGNFACPCYAAQVY
jgi:hypothetical protein